MDQRWLLVPLVALAVTGCQVQTCTDADCGGALLRIFVEGPDHAAVPEASYEIVIDLDGAAYTGQCVMPQSSTTGCEPFDGDGPYEVSALVSAPGTIWISVFDPQRNEHQASQVSLLVTADGTTVVDEAWSPSYETTYPNGEECSPACTHATEDLTVVVPPGI